MCRCLSATSVSLSVCLYVCPLVGRSVCRCVWTYLRNIRKQLRILDTTIIRIYLKAAQKHLNHAWLVILMIQDNGDCNLFPASLRIRENKMATMTYSVLWRRFYCYWKRHELFKYSTNIRARAHTYTSPPTPTYPHACINTSNWTYRCKPTNYLTE